MMVEAGSGVVISFELVQAAPRSAELFGHVAPFIAKGLKTAGSRPREVRVTRQMLHDLLTPIAKEARFRLKFVSDLPALHQAQEALYASYRN